MTVTRYDTRQDYTQGRLQRWLNLESVDPVLYTVCTQFRAYSVTYVSRAVHTTYVSRAVHTTLCRFAWRHTQLLDSFVPTHCAAARVLAPYVRVPPLTRWPACVQQRSRAASA